MFFTFYIFKVRIVSDDGVLMFYRIVFMVMYWGSYQPWRSIFFALGQLTMLVMAVWSVIAVFYNNIW